MNQGRSATQRQPATLTVIVPSRGRPHNIRELADIFAPLAPNVDLLVAVDNDDPYLDEYSADHAKRRTYALVSAPRERLGPTLNKWAVHKATYVPMVGFIGDDHRPRSEGWCDRIIAELRDLKTGIVYGNDLLQRENLPTAVFMTSDIINTIGYMVPSGIVHLFADNAWLELGRQSQSIRYLDDVIIEHCHYSTGKAEGDATYQQANSREVWAHDEQVFNDWKANQLPNDAGKVRALRG